MKKADKDFPLKRFSNEIEFAFISIRLKSTVGLPEEPLLEIRPFERSTKLRLLGKGHDWKLFCRPHHLLKLTSTLKLHFQVCGILKYSVKCKFILETKISDSGVILVYVKHLNLGKSSDGRLTIFLLKCVSYLLDKCFLMDIKRILQ